MNSYLLRVEANVAVGRSIPKSTLHWSKVWRSQTALMEVEAQTPFRNFDTKNCALFLVLLNQHIKIN